MLYIHTYAVDPEKYIVYDPNIFPMLKEFRRAGKKVFLVTNSLWDYTQVVMNYLEGTCVCMFSMCIDCIRCTCVLTYVIGCYFHTQVVKLGTQKILTGWIILM